jgi:hypothetical protein
LFNNAQVNHSSGDVTEQLHLDVVRLLHKLLHKDVATAPKRSRRL